MGVADVLLLCWLCNQQPNSYRAARRKAFFWKAPSCRLDLTYLLWDWLLTQSFCSHHLTRNVSHGSSTGSQEAQEPVGLSFSTFYPTQQNCFSNPFLPLTSLPFKEFIVSVFVHTRRFFLCIAAPKTLALGWLCFFLHYVVLKVWLMDCRKPQALSTPPKDSLNPTHTRDRYICLSLQARTSNSKEATVIQTIHNHRAKIM